MLILPLCQQPPASCKRNVLSVYSDLFSELIFSWFCYGEHKPSSKLKFSQADFDLFVLKVLFSLLS